MTQKQHFKIFTFVFFIFSFLFFISTTPALATSATSWTDIRAKLGNVAEQSGAGFAPNPAIPELAGTIVYGALTLLGLIFFILVVYGGVLHLTAGGNDEQAKKSTKIITRALIGLLIVVFAGAITQFIIKVAAPVTVECPRGQTFVNGQCVNTPPRTP